MLRDFQRRMRFARGRADDEQRERKTLALHFLRDVNHLIERGRDESAQADDIDAELLRRGENFFA